MKTPVHLIVIVYERYYNIIRGIMKICIKCIKDTEISCDDRTKRLICLTFIGRFDMLIYK